MDHKNEADINYHNLKNINSQIKQTNLSYSLPYTINVEDLNKLIRIIKKREEQCLLLLECYKKKKFSRIIDLQDLKLINSIKEQDYSRQVEEQSIIFKYDQLKTNDLRMKQTINRYCLRILEIFDQINQKIKIQGYYDTEIDQFTQIFQQNVQKYIQNEKVDIDQVLVYFSNLTKNKLKDYITKLLEFNLEEKDISLDQIIDQQKMNFKNWKQNENNNNNNEQKSPNQKQYWDQKNQYTVQQMRHKANNLTPSRISSNNPNNNNNINNSSINNSQIMPNINSALSSKRVSSRRRNSQNKSNQKSHNEDEQQQKIGMLTSINMPKRFIKPENIVNDLLQQRIFNQQQQKSNNYNVSNSVYTNSMSIVAQDKKLLKLLRSPHSIMSKSINLDASGDANSLNGTNALAALTDDRQINYQQLKQYFNQQSIQQKQPKSTFLQPNQSLNQSSNFSTIKFDNKLEGTLNQNNDSNIMVQQQIETPELSPLKYHEYGQKNSNSFKLIESQLQSPSNSQQITNQFCLANNINGAQIGDKQKKKQIMAQLHQNIQYQKQLQQFYDKEYIRLYDVMQPEKFICKTGFICQRNMKEISERLIQDMIQKNINIKQSTDEYYNLIQTQLKQKNNKNLLYKLQKNGIQGVQNTNQGHGKIIYNKANSLSAEIPDKQNIQRNQKQSQQTFSSNPVTNTLLQSVQNKIINQKLQMVIPSKKFESQTEMIEKDQELVDSTINSNNANQTENAPLTKHQQQQQILRASQQSQLQQQNQQPPGFPNTNYISHSLAYKFVVNRQPKQSSRVELRLPKIQSNTPSMMDQQYQFKQSQGDTFCHSKDKIQDHNQSNVNKHDTLNSNNLKSDDHSPFQKIDDQDIIQPSFNSKNRLLQISGINFKGGGYPQSHYYYNQQFREDIKFNLKSNSNGQVLNVICGNSNSNNLNDNNKINQSHVKASFSTIPTNNRNDIQNSYIRMFQHLNIKMRQIAPLAASTNLKYQINENQASKDLPNEQIINKFQLRRFNSSSITALQSQHIHQQQPTQEEIEHNLQTLQIKSHSKKTLSQKQEELKEQLKVLNDQCISNPNSLNDSVVVNKTLNKGNKMQQDSNQKLKSVTKLQPANDINNNNNETIIENNKTQNKQNSNNKKKSKLNKYNIFSIYDVDIQ